MSRGNISESNVFEICDVPSTEKMRKIFEYIGKANLKNALKVFNGLWKENYCVHDFINYMARNLEVME